MAGKIPPEFIDNLLSRVDVVDVINQRVPLRRAGSEYKACCPFHDEKTPSFTVSPNKQFYHCFGCGAHGTALGFLMEYDRLSFPEAVEELATSVGLELPTEIAFQQGPDTRPLYQLIDQAADYFTRQLRQHPDAKRATDYLQQRGLSGEIAQTYRIGFAPPGWNNLLSQLGDSRERIGKLETAGLISSNNGKQYDRFRDRIMFPIHDTRGRVVGFGGRVMGDDTPKYLNSPETPIFHKGKEPYGLYEARKALKDISSLLVVEGYMDVVALAQYGIQNAVATLGTATTADHLEKLFRSTPEVIFCFDGDRAGKDAAWKALETTLPLLRDGRQARFLFLPDGEDPDSQVRKQGKEAFLIQMEQAQPLSEFLFSKLAEQVDMTTLDGRARLVALATPYLEKLPKGIFRDMMKQQLIRLSGSKTPQKAKGTPRLRADFRRGSRPMLMKPVHRAIALLLQYPEIASREDLPQAWKQPETPGTAILNQLLEILRKNPTYSTAVLVEHWEDDSIRHHLGKLATTDLAVTGDQVEQFLGCLQRLEKEARQAAGKEVRNKLRPSDMTEDEKNLLRKLYSTKKSE
ncbi:DNA primase [Thiolapillus sp.]|uniref:DNA primase n=2 Tax=Thiolapillus sp. TaxID=2017437 RepID=UPI0025F4D332|nr:DNA primase [Thiolapillus sp.]